MVLTILGPGPLHLALWVRSSAIWLRQDCGMRSEKKALPPHSAIPVQLKLTYQVHKPTLKQRVMTALLMRVS